MKKLLNTFWFLGLFAILIFPSLGAEKKQGLVTQGALAKQIAYLSGVADQTMAPFTEEDAIKALTKRGWIPLGGWRVDAVATKDDFYVLMAQTLGLKVKKPEDPASYREALNLAGYSFAGAVGTKEAPKHLSQRNRSIDRVSSRMVLEVQGTAEYREHQNELMEAMKTFNKKDESWKKLTKRQYLKPGIVIRTGKNSYVDLLYARGVAQRILANSEVILESVDEKTNGLDSSQHVVLFLSKGEAISMVDPMNESSHFLMRDEYGKFEIDRSLGCQFSAKIIDNEELTLTPAEKRLLKHDRMSEVQPQGCTYVVIYGKGKYVSSGGQSKDVKADESVTMEPDSKGGGGDVKQMTLTLRSGEQIQDLVSMIRFVTGIISNRIVQEIPEMTSETLLTTAELSAFLTGFGGSGISSNPASNAVTPIE
jgi:hypothetical protein